MKRAFCYYYLVRVVLVQEGILYDFYIYKLTWLTGRRFGIIFFLFWGDFSFQFEINLPLLHYRLSHCGAESLADHCSHFCSVASHSWRVDFRAIPVQAWSCCSSGDILVWDPLELLGSYLMSTFWSVLTRDLIPWLIQWYLWSGAQKSCDCMKPVLLMYATSCNYRWW